MPLPQSIFPGSYVDAGDGDEDFDAWSKLVENLEYLLGRADTADANIALKAALISPSFAGTPTGPTAPAGTSTAQLATTAFVRAAITALVNSSPATLDTLKELADAIGDDPNFAATIAAQLGLKAPLDSPALTGTPTAPTAASTDSSTKLATTAFAKAAAAIPVGQCRLTYSSTTALVLKPFQGNLLWVNGALRTIPAGGVSLANTGLTFGTLYYVYAFMNGSTLGLEASTTGHATDATYGHEIKSGDSTRTLVGMVYMDGTSGTGTFANTPTKRYVANWFNRTSRSFAGSSAQIQTGSTSPVEANASARVSFVAWSDESIDLQAPGYTTNSSAGNYCQSNLAINGAAVGAPVLGTSAIAGAACSATPAYAGELAEGFNYATLLLNVNAGTGSFYLGIAGKVRS